MSFSKSVFLLFVGSFIMLSCSSDIEPIDPALQPGGGNSGGDGSGGGVSTGDYWPMAQNNSWIFSQNGVPQAPMLITNTEQINSRTYYAYENFVGVSLGGSNFTGTVHSRKANGNYYVRNQVTIPGTGGNPTITVSPLEILVLKDFLEVNQTWTQELTQTTTITGTPPINTPVSIVGKILEKNASLTIGTTTYTNIIKVELVQSTQGVVNTNYYWFAKDIGLVKYQMILQGSNLVYELQSYNLN